LKAGFRPFFFFSRPIFLKKKFTPQEKFLHLILIDKVGEVMRYVAIAIRQLVPLVAR
jgi:hypothetical protein